MNDFVPLHCHSYFSILDGLNSPEQLVARSAELGHSAMALTDHGVCAGLYRFNEACKSVKQCKDCLHFFAGKSNGCPKCQSKNVEKKPSIKPIFGMEGYVVDDVNVREISETRRHITLFAKNEIGYQNLIWLSTFGCTSGSYQKPRISLQLLDQHKDGLVVGTACVNGVVCGEYFDGNDTKAESVMGDLKDMLNGDLYVEFMNHVCNPEISERQGLVLDAMKKTLSLADRMGVKSVFTYDSHYCLPEDAFCHDVLLSVQTRNTIKNPKRMSFRSSDFYMKSIEESRERCMGRNDLIINTKEVAEKISVGLLPHIPFQNLLPPFNLPAGFKTEVQYLKMLIKEGMIARGIINKQSYRDRILMELGHIEKLGFVRYFLVLWDVVNFAKKSGIPVGPGRGSAAGSLCIYCLGITQLDPLKYDLLFERFINPDRVSPPDVDIDYADDRQNEMFKYAAVRYGQEFVARIGTYNTLGAKDAIKRVGKALDIGGDWEKSDMEKSSWKSGQNTLQIVNEMTKCIDAKPGSSLSDIISSNADIKNYVRDYPKLFETALRMEGTITSPGEHAAGIVLCNRPIVELIPMRHDKDEGFCSQFDKTEVEPLGLLKYDFLGLKNLRIIDKCVKLIKERHGIDIDVNALEPDDQKVFGMLNDGHVHGVFQFEGGDGRMGRDGHAPFHTMSGLLMNIRIDSFSDMIACVALFRPGTLNGKWDGKSVPETYCDYKHGRKPIKLLHPKMGELLGETYGMMCFGKEQTIYTESGATEIASVTSNYSVSSRVDNESSVKYSNPSNQGAFQSGVKDVYRYTFSNGYSVLCTDNHTYRLLDGSYLEIDEIFNNKVTIPYELANDLVDDISSVSGEVKKTWALLGILVGDGSISDSTPVVCAGNVYENAKSVAVLFSEIYGNDTNPYIYWHCGSWYVSLGFKSNKKLFGPEKNSPLINFMKLCKLDKSCLEKRLPISEMGNSRSKYLAIVAGMIDSDGHIGQDISFSSGNKGLLEDFSYALWRLGYYSYKSWHSVHVLDSKKLFSELQSFLVIKSHSESPQSNGESIRLDGKLVAEKLRLLIGDQSIRNFCLTNNLNRSSVHKILKGQLTCKYRTLRNILTLSDIKSMAVLFIEKKEFVGKQDVYDLSMTKEAGNNFFVAPGVVAHNCYQEQVMLMARELALFTLAEADTFRKGIGKKDPILIESLKQKFIDGCSRNSIDSETAYKIFELCEAFAGYGFNKAHAACYAFIGYQCAWLKYYYKIEFADSLMSAYIGNEAKLDKYQRVFEKSGVHILPYHINMSKLEFSIEGQSVRKPLTSLKGVGEKAVQAIVASQPFSDLKDFMSKISGQVVNKALFETLVQSGCMDCLGMSKSTLLSVYEQARSDAKLLNKEHDKQRKSIEEFGALDLFGMPTAGL